MRCLGEIADEAAQMPEESIAFSAFGLEIILSSVLGRWGLGWEGAFTDDTK